MSWANTRWKVKSGRSNFDHTAKPSNVALPPNDGSTQAETWTTLVTPICTLSAQSRTDLDGLGIPLTEFAVSLQKTILENNCSRREEVFADDHRLGMTTPMGPALDDAVITFLQSPRFGILVIEVKFTGSTIFSAREYVDHCRREVWQCIHMSVKVNY